MSFIKTLAAVAIGVAATKGYQKYQKSGGMAGMQDMLKGAGDSPAAEQLARMADQFGIPGGSTRVREMLNQMGSATASATEATTAGLGSLMNSMRSAAEAGSLQSAELMSAIFGTTPAGPMMEEQAKLVLRAMIMAAKADGQITSEERAAIMEHVKDASPEEREFVLEELKRPIDIASLASSTSEAARETVYSASLSAISVDTKAEQAYLRQLAAALRLSDEKRDAIHAQLGIPPLSAA
ncbi:DUF533 domain-containing protein [Tropicimonas isoalkanivorans]|uniref:Uncharacterized membrane protein YebE, DUF533 family n=1 Tax=Tropicimonas isoalkanivorans TaxID=441112 RepID=A0A1I1JPZ2_9RHOB|nr:DUF533 domain-containing protein [Tropicimonas isoalkanivorans]SFC47943.1 Uncharacterized membrane protein YebE, DUF533 family [Tropicimonas isoalkanivorans]